MDNQNILNALNDSHLVTVGGLNKVYRYVMSRIKISGASGSAVYKVQGSQYWDTLIKLDFLTGEDAKEGIIEGRIYNVLDPDPDGVTGANYVCLRQYRYNSATQYYEVITYVLSSDTEYDSEKIYYIKEGDNYKVVPNPQPTDNPHDKGWYEQTWTNQIETSTDTFIQVTKSNISQNWSIFWDSFGGSQPKADKEGQLGIVTIGDNIDISDTGKISVPLASSSVPGVLKVGSNLKYTDNTVNIDFTNPISVSSGTIVLNYDSDTLDLDNNKLKVKTSTGTNLGIVKSGDSINIDSSTGAVSVNIDGETIKRDSTANKNLYVRPATATDLGAVSVGNNIDVSSGGQISVPYANQDNKKGVVTTGNNIVNNSGEISIRYANDDNEAGVVKIGTGLKYSGHEVSLSSTDPINVSNDGIVSLKYDETLTKNSSNKLSVVQATSSGIGIVKAGDSISIDDTTAAVSVKIDNATIQRDTTTKNLYVRTANGDTTGVVCKGTNVSIDSDGKVSVTKLVNSSTSNTTTIIDVANNGTAPVVKITGKKDVDDTAPVSSTSALYVDGNILAEGNISGHKVFHAVWNDISDAIEVQDSLEIEAGRCYRFDGTEYSKTSEYCQKGIIGIHSDTAGSMLGKKGRHKELDISVGGFVLAYVDRQYESGTPLTSGPNGTLTEMKREDVREYPERLVATYWKPETETEWGSDMYKVTVNGRHWVKIK